MSREFLFFVIASLLISLGGCDNAPKQDFTEAEPATQARYFKEYSGSQEALKIIRDSLYHDKNDALYFKAPYHAENRSIYLQYEGVPDPEHKEPTKLTAIIDRDSWHQVFDSFYADEKSLFCHYSMSDGGNIGRVRGAAPMGISVIVLDTENDTWRKIAVDTFDRSTLEKQERAWHITDGEIVIGVRCDTQGSLSSWTPEEF